MAIADDSRPRSTLGTPTEASWPGVSQLPDFKNTFPQWARKARACEVGLVGAGLRCALCPYRLQEWTTVVPTLCAAGCDLLAVRAPCLLGVCAAAEPPLHVCAAQQMLVYEPSKRVSARVAMSHPFFDDLAPGGDAGGVAPMVR